uniref:Putative secreted protein n=1 Tax=Anopheles marajoara TaxID=58244 RepID=A0A2M4CA25_9DIPT
MSIEFKMISLVRFLATVTQCRIIFRTEWNICGAMNGIDFVNDFGLTAGERVLCKFFEQRIYLGPILGTGEYVASQPTSQPARANQLANQA